MAGETTLSKAESVGSPRCKICVLAMWARSRRIFIVIYTALHEMQTRYSDEKAVRPSVCHCHTRAL